MDRLHRRDVAPSSPRVIPLDELLPHLCVRPPYLRLTDTLLQGDRYVATVAAEAPLGLERGPMSAAELLRHAAVALRAHAVLATPGGTAPRVCRLRRGVVRLRPDDAPPGTPLRLESELLPAAPAGPRGRLRALRGDALLAELELTLATAPAEHYARVFSDHARPAPPLPTPYARRLPGELRASAGSIEKLLPAVPERACAGYHPGFPSLPPPVAAGELVHLATELNGGPGRVAELRVDVLEPLWAGEGLRLRVWEAGTDDDERLLEGAAWGEGNRTALRVAVALRPG